MSVNPIPIPTPSGEDGSLRHPMDFQTRRMRLNSARRYAVTIW